MRMQTCSCRCQCYELTYALIGLCKYLTPFGLADVDNKFLKVTFDPETYEKGFQETDNLQTVSDDVFDYLRLLSFITPDVPGIEQWSSIDVGPKVPRYHDLHELVFILNGKGAYEIKDRIYPVKKGDVVSIKPHELHRYTNDSDIDAISLHFSFTQLELKTEVLEKKYSSRQQDEFLDFLTDHYPFIHIISTLESSHVFSKVRQLFQEFSAPSPGSRLMVSIHFIEILILLARNYLYAKKGDSLIPNEIDVRNDMMVRQILEYIDKNYSKQINTSEIFADYYMHPNHCRFLFKQAVGTSVSGYILRRRMTEARRLIVETSLSLQEISDKVGIKDYYYFLRAFKKIQGITPGSLRKNPTH